MQTLTTTKAISIPCPNGCNRTIAAEGKEIHLCIVRTRTGKRIHTEREYIGTIDGVIEARGRTYGETDTLLNDRMLNLIEHDLMTGLVSWNI